MTHDYVLAKGAADDLEGIIRHTNEHWGETQCRNYAGQLEKAAVSLARGEGAYRDLSAIHPHLRMAHCGRHYIFCVMKPDASPIILAIFHDRMDIFARLRNRLT